MEAFHQSKSPFEYKKEIRIINYRKERERYGSTRVFVVECGARVGADLVVVELQLVLQVARYAHQLCRNRLS
jgi:hypothetical protein